MRLRLRHLTSVLGSALVLAALSPAAMAKDKPDCGFEIRPEDPAISYAKGGYYKDSRYLETISSRRLAYVRPFFTRTTPHLRGREFSAVLEMSAKDGEYTNARWLKFRMKEPVGQDALKGSVKRRYLMQFIAKEGTEEFEIEGYARSFDKFFDKERKLFGNFKGIVRVLVYLTEKPAGESADLLFSFRAADLNRAYAIAEAAQLKAQEVRAEKDCKVRLYTTPSGIPF